MINFSNILSKGVPVRRYTFRRNLPLQTLTGGELKRLQSTQAQILRDFVKFAASYNIQFFALAGTALGAVRHGACIPWDDDIDLGLLRPEYNRFLTLAQEAEEPLGFFLQTNPADASFPLAMTKLRLPSIELIERSTAGSPMRHGVFIDIFPIDRKPANASLSALYGVLLRLAAATANSLAGVGTVLVRVGPFGEPIPKLTLESLRLRALGKLCNLRENSLTRRWSGHGSLTIVSGSYGYKREWFAEEWFTEFRMVRFGDVELPVFGKVENYLDHLYEQWRVPVPVQQRSPRHELVAFAG